MDPFASSVNNKREDIFAKTAMFEDDTFDVKEDFFQTATPPTKKAEAPRFSLVKTFEAMEAVKLQAKVSSRFAAWGSAASEFVASFMKKVFEIIVQAIQMSLFKFAIEFCAMAIQALATTMTSMKMPLPRIDTTGVMYQNPNNAPPVQQAQATNSRYDNPFGSPYSSASSW